MHILKIESGDYRAHFIERTQHLGDYEASSIKEAILLAAENPLSDLAGFHLWFEYVSVGTVSAGEMRFNAEVLAKELMVRHAKFSQSTGKDPLG